MAAMSQPADRTFPRYRTRMGGILTVAAAATIFAACGSDNSHAGDTLPPIATTTTTTTLPPTTTTIPDHYVIQAGDSLSAIAKMFGLSTQELAAFNGITNPQHIESGQTIKIPQPGDLASSTTASSVVDSTVLDATTVTPTSAP
ncbi:MAG: hypothetical protein JWL72_4859 [Ilumatobacteraceae bacterium]|nr:hypothetical protein [Ilumatobacteraceae bacterium]MCU1391521.1 hypothetical protein [Ilumatobacteraceae bacterium]